MITDHCVTMLALQRTVNFTALCACPQRRPGSVSAHFRYVLVIVARLTHKPKKYSYGRCLNGAFSWQEFRLFKGQILLSWWRWFGGGGGWEVVWWHSFGIR